LFRRCPSYIYVISMDIERVIYGDII
jgi:hypothetical protein